MWAQDWPTALQRGDPLFRLLLPGVYAPAAGGVCTNRPPCKQSSSQDPGPALGLPGPGQRPSPLPSRPALARGAARAEGDRQRGETEGPLQRPFSSQGIKRMLLGFALLGLLGGSHAPTPLLSHAPLDRPSSREAAASQAEWGDHSWGVPQERQEESSRPWPALVRRLSRRHPGCADPPR